VKTDPKHYSVISENDQVGILKVHYGPHEKSIMHSHPNVVAVFLNDAKGTFTPPDGKKQDFTAKAGDAQFTPAGTHFPENTTDMPMDLILEELKSPAKSATKLGGGTPASGRGPHLSKAREVGQPASPALSGLTPNPSPVSPTKHCRSGIEIDYVDSVNLIVYK
jgi:quercetin dioxygenase-like cupin family protein